jgi:hypothetical protein
MSSMAHRLTDQAHLHAQIKAELSAEHEKALRAGAAQDTQQLSHTRAKLEVTQKALRDVQATMIAERLERCRLERDLKARENKALGYKEQLQTAAEALRRLKKEGQRTEEDRVRYAYALAEAKSRYVSSSRLLLLFVVVDGTLELG